MDASIFAKQSEFALAAYANLQAGVPNESALQDQGKGMSARQAHEFASHYTVLTQYTDTPAEGGQGTSLSATVFKDTSGNLTLAIRGTAEFLGDWLPTDKDIGLDGAGFDQIVALWNWWQRVSHPAGDLVPQAGRVGKRVLVCPPNTTIAAPILRGQTIKPFAHPTGLDNATLTGGNLIQTGLWQSQDKRHLYRLEGDTLSIDNRLRIQGFHNGDLGISLGNAPAPVATMQATLTPQADVYGSGYMVGNTLETVEQWIQADTHLSTRIDGGAGNDLLLGAGHYQKANQLRIAQGVTVAIDDTINGGTGRDWINGSRHPTPGAGTVPAWGRYGSRIGKPASRAGGVPCLP